MSDRPPALTRCEILVVLALVMRIATAYWGDGPWRVALVDAQTTPGVGLVALAIGICAPAALVFWATRRASRVAVWLFSVWVMLLGVGFVVSIALGQSRLSPISSASLVILLIYIGVVILLLTSTVRRWMRGERTAAEIAAEFS